MTFETALRAQLLRGAEKRRQTERRRRYVVMAAPVILIAVLAGTWWISGTGDDGNDLATTPGLTADALAACDALLDYDSARFVLDVERGRHAIDRFASAASASADPVFMAAAATAAATDVDAHTVETYNALEAAMARCRELDAPGHVPEFVPAEQGPEPEVRLEDFGEEVPFEPVPHDGGGLGPATKQIRGRDLSPVEAARTASGAYVARWSRAGGDGRTYCYLIDDPTGGSGGCGTDLASTTVTGLRANAHGTVYATVEPDISFVVLEVDGRAFVQRPVLRHTIFLTDGIEHEATVRWHGVDGEQVACWRTGPVRPDHAPQFTEC